MDRAARRRWCLVCALLSTCGCAMLRRQQAATDAVGACRQLSREGAAALERGDCPRAQALLEEAVSVSPRDVDARRQLAEVLWQAGSRQEAVVHMEAAVRLDEHHASTVVRSGEMLLALNSVDKALARAERALSLDPTLPGAWMLRARVYRRQGDDEHALADFQQALRYHPYAPDALLEVAELQYQLGRPQRALASVQFLLDAYTPDDQPQRALWLQGLAYQAVDRPHDAAASLYAASTHGPANPELLYQLAQAQTAAGDPAGALAAARQAAEAGHAGGRVLVAQLQADGTVEQGTLRR